MKDENTVTIAPVAYNAEQAAKAANVSLPTMYQWIHSTGFPAFRAGKKWVIPVQRFTEWLAEQVQ